MAVLRTCGEYTDLGCQLPSADGVRRTCTLRITSRIRGNQVVVTSVETSNSCKPDELERRRRSGQASKAMQTRIAKLEESKHAVVRKRRREIGVEGMSTTLSKKFTPMSYAGIEVNEYAGESAHVRRHFPLNVLLIFEPKLISLDAVP